MTIHYYKKCEFNGYFSEHTADKEKVTCKRCLCKYKLEKNIYIISRNGYLNILDKIPEDGKVILSTTTKKVRL